MLPVRGELQRDFHRKKIYTTNNIQEMTSNSYWNSPETKSLRLISFSKNPIKYLEYFIQNLTLNKIYIWLFRVINTQYTHTPYQQVHHDFICLSRFQSRHRNTCLIFKILLYGICERNWVHSGGIYFNGTVNFS